MEYNPDIYRALGVDEITKDGDVLIYPGQYGRREDALAGYRVSADDSFTIVRLLELPQKPVAKIPAPAIPVCAATRKGLPLATGVFDYFPLALLAIAELSRIGNDQHNPGKPLFWDRSKSGDEADSLARHFLQRGTLDTDGVRHSTKVCWRAMAALQKELEAAQ